MLFVTKRRMSFTPHAKQALSLAAKDLGTTREVVISAALETLSWDGRPDSLAHCICFDVGKIGADLSAADTVSTIPLTDNALDSLKRFSALLGFSQAMLVNGTLETLYPYTEALRSRCESLNEQKERERIARVEMKRIKRAIPEHVKRKMENGN